MTQREMVVSIAQNEIGNYGGEKYWSWYGFGSHVHWCACFASWCLYQAGVKCADLRPYIDKAETDQEAQAISDFIKGDYNAILSKGCVQMLEFYEGKGWRLKSNEAARSGDIVLYEWNYNDPSGIADGVDHVGIVEYVEGSSPSTQILHMIEGNWGNQVTRTTYNYSDPCVWAICRPRYDGTAVVDPDPSDEYDTYIVKSGDTLGKIAVSYGLMVSEVAGYNNIKDANVIYVGQQLRIPVVGRRNYIKLFQQAINLAKIASLEEDGIWGPLTESAATNAIVRSGTTGTMAYIAQVMLKAYGYITFEPSAEFTSHSTAATILYQRDHNLDADGIIGVNTWKSMFLVA